MLARCVRLWYSGVLDTAPKNTNKRRVTRRAHFRSAPYSCRAARDYSVQWTIVIRVDSKHFSATRRHEKVSSSWKSLVIELKQTCNKFRCEICYSFVEISSALGDFTSWPHREAMPLDPTGATLCLILTQTLTCMFHVIITDCLVTAGGRARGCRVCLKLKTTILFRGNIEFW